MNGKLIVCEGIDGSGKATQSQLYSEYLKNRGIKQMNVSFPDYKSPSSALIKMYLDGEFGDTADSVNPYAASSFYAVDRYTSYKTVWGNFYNNGGIVIADRYTTSNDVHQCSKLPDNEQKDFLDWLFQYEYRYIGIPGPDEVIYLRVDPDVSQRLMSERYRNDEGKKDIHEKNIGYLKRSAASADRCAELFGWHIIECCENNAIRPVSAILHDVIKTLSI